MSDLAPTPMLALIVHADAELRTLLAASATVILRIAP